MNYKEIKSSDINIKLSAFNGEYHAIIEGTNPMLDTETQYANIRNALASLQNQLPENATLVFKRYFVSDAFNQASLLPKAEYSVVSIVQQPPLNNTKGALWAYFVEDTTIKNNGENAVIAERTHYSHFFNTQLHSHHKDEFTQTEDIFKKYTSELTRHHLTLKDHCIRTWIYVQGVDTHYADMVEARKLYFCEQGLTEQTHYIASTGIEAKYIYPETLVLMDSYAVSGIAPGQITFLKGSSHLNPTHEYGVTFERATAVDYGDRRHIFVSGTASIDNKGEIVHPLHIGKQVERTLENIEVLLHEGGAEISDIAQLIVYLRDTADYNVVSSYLAEQLPDTPKVIVCAPVCRPGWLVEMECIAIKAVENSSYEVF